MIDHIQTTALIGLGILAGTYLLTIFLLWRWLRLSRAAMIMALTERDISQRKLDKTLRRLRWYASAIRSLRLLTLESPLLALALLVVLFITWLF